MEQIKRPANNIIHGCNEVTTVELNCLTKQYMTTFEDLSNELIYEIFEFVHSHQAFEAFYDLNQRFQNFFIHSNLPIKMNIFSVSKSKFHRYLTHFIIPNAYRIKSLHFSHSFATDMWLLLLPIMTNFTRLEAVTLNNIDSGRTTQITDHLSCLPVLSSLTITCTGNQTGILHKIFLLRALKYCQLKISRCSEMLSVSINEFSSIKHLVINNTISIDQVDSLLSYVPQLSRLSLSIAYLHSYKNSRTQRSPLILNHLRNVSLKLGRISFHEFESLMLDFFRQVQVLRVVVYCDGFNGVNREYVSADLWERLISTYLLNLNIFDFQFKCCIQRTDDYPQAFETQINKFKSSFWIEHQWFFEYQHCPRSNFAIFYSRNPYRRTDYVSCEEQTKNMWLPAEHINEDSIHHLYISSSDVKRQLSVYFPNTTELTLDGAFHESGDSFAINLARFIPLRLLTKLILPCQRFRFDQLVELLQSTENIHTLKLHSIFFYRTDSVSIQQSEIFRIVSKKNTVTNVTISGNIALGDIQLLTSLFPRIEYLTINLHKEDLEPISRFLLSKSNNSTSCLSSLCFSDQWMDLTKKLKILIDCEHLLHDFMIKLTDRKLYLWW